MRLRLAAQSLALAISVGAIATLSILVFRGQLRALRSVQLFAPRLPAAPIAAAMVNAKPASLLHDQALIRVEHEPSLALVSPQSRATLGRPVSASELFELANQAREQGHLSEAVTQGQQLEQLFPSSAEGIKAHLLLGVVYLTQGEPNRALGELATYRHIGNPETMAEALWAQAQALRQLARPSDEREIIAELLKSYPRSVYVAAAKERLSALSPAP